MRVELDTLEARIRQVAELCHTLRQETIALRQQLLATQQGWDAGQKAVYSARLNHVGKRRYGDDYGNDAGYVSGYTTLDLMASWRIRDWKIDARVLNAADERYAAYAGYGFNSTTLANDTFYYPADGRTFGMTARYDFR